MGQQGQREEEKVAGEEEVHDSLPTPKASGHRCGDQNDRGNRDGDVTTHTEVLEREINPDELSDDCQHAQ